MTAAKVAKYYEEVSEVISAELGGGMHFGYWRGLAHDSSMAEASRHMSHLLIDKLGMAERQLVLDVGCGTGGPALELVRATGAEVVGIDLSERHVRLATELARADGLADRASFHLGDATSLPFEPGSFDGALMLESFFHMPDQAGVLRQIAKVLRPGGRLVIGNLVQRTPLSDEQNAALEELWREGHIAALLPLADYPSLVADSGLLLEELLDVSDHTISPTFAAIRKIRAELSRGVAPSPNGSAEPQEETGEEIMELFASMPEIGFAIIVATKPRSS